MALRHRCASRAGVESSLPALSTEGAELEGFGEFGGESALGLVFPLTRAAIRTGRTGTSAGRSTLIGTGTRTGGRTTGRATRGTTTTSCDTFRWLSRVCPQDFVLEGSTVEAANDRLHLVSGWRFHKCESLGFLRFVVSNYFDRIRDQIFR